MNSIGTKYLETERLSLRRISLNDANNIYREILGNKERLHFLDWNYAAAINEANTYVENIINSYSKEYYFFWVIEEKVTQKFVGCIFVCNWVVLPIPSKRYVRRMEYLLKVFILTFLKYLKVTQCTCVTFSYLIYQRFTRV